MSILSKSRKTIITALKSAGCYDTHYVSHLFTKKLSNGYQWHATGVSNYTNTAAITQNGISVLIDAVKSLGLEEFPNIKVSTFDNQLFITATK